MNTNGWLVSPAFAKWAIGALLSIGVWVGTLQADLGNKAEKIDVATQVATQTEVLKNIATALSDIKISVKSIDDRQRETDIAAAELKAKVEAKDK